MIEFLENKAGEYAYACATIPIGPEVQDGCAGVGIFLSNAERIIYDQHRSEKRRNEWLAGRVAAKRAFFKFSSRTNLDQKARQITVLNDANRVPYLLDQPDLCLSISHSHAYSLAVVSQRKIGIDIELIESRPGSLARRFFHPAELAWIGQVCNSPEEYAELVTRTWTRKEAVAKFLQMGGSLDFKLLDTSSDTVVTEFFPDGLIGLLSAKWNGYWVSLAVQADPTPGETI